MSEEIKNTPEEIEAVKAEDLEDTVEKENDAEAVIEEISTNIAFCFCDKRLNSQNKIRISRFLLKYSYNF